MHRECDFFHRKKNSSLESAEYGLKILLSFLTDGMTKKSPIVAHFPKIYPILVYRKL